MKYGSSRFNPDVTVRFHKFDPEEAWEARPETINFCHGDPDRWAKEAAFLSSKLPECQHVKEPSL